MSQTGAVEDAVRRRILELAEAASGRVSAAASDFSPAQLDARRTAADRALRQLRGALTPADRRALAEADAELYDERGLFR